MTDVYQHTAALPQTVTDAATELLPLLRNFDTGRFALTLSGSMSKSTSDALSDVDFRFYSDNRRPDPGPAWERDWDRLRLRWQERGVTLDEVWFRTVSEVDLTIDQWLAGVVVPDEMIWTIWGYHPLTDLSRQLAVVDADALVERWRGRLTTYPSAVRDATIRRHLTPLRYWRGDYHYENKATRGDFVFLAGLTATLVHHLIQVTAALNGKYFPGDGNNLVLAAQFDIAPFNFPARIEEILYPTGGADGVVEQRRKLVALFDEVEVLLGHSFPDESWQS